MLPVYHAIGILLTSFPAFVKISCAYLAATWSCIAGGAINALAYSVPIPYFLVNPLQELSINAYAPLALPGIPFGPGVSYFPPDSICLIVARIRPIFPSNPVIGIPIMPFGPAKPPIMPPGIPPAKLGIPPGIPPGIPLGIPPGIPLGIPI